MRALWLSGLTYAGLRLSPIKTELGLFMVAFVKALNQVKAQLLRKTTSTQSCVSLLTEPVPHTLPSDVFACPQSTEQNTISSLHHSITDRTQPHPHVSKVCTLACTHRKSHVHTCYQIWQLSIRLTLHFSKQQNFPVLFLHTTTNTTANITATRATTSRGNPM